MKLKASIIVCRQILKLFASLGFCLVLASCINLAPDEDPTRYFVLGKQGEPQAKDGFQQVALRLEKIEVPIYLESNKIVTRKGETEISYHEYFRWVSGFYEVLTEAVSETLARHPKIKSVSVFPHASRQPSDYTIQIKILRFEGNEDEGVQLFSKWKIYHDGEIESPKWQGMSKFSEEWDGLNYTVLVETMSTLLEQFCREILENL